ncbi:hypothetical protein CIT292_06743 [Citrobacter youngae ATCC 29220]|uniref:Uncharacterized protein n=1 Tax=Citrobacter youngae ATCC 29220 TaxID=500640 RepID=D4B6A6_9ENTR|nr:hypothetical protein CIT292_06743 [Citrobacter youngae ATCC 29220]
MGTHFWQAKYQVAFRTTMIMCTGERFTDGPDGYFFCWRDA